MWLPTQGRYKYLKLNAFQHRAYVVLWCFATKCEPWGNLITHQICVSASGLVGFNSAATAVEYAGIPSISMNVFSDISN